MSLVGCDLNRMLTCVINEASVAKLKKQVIETISLFEGLFGDGECNFIVHELIHMPDQMLQMGPISGWWTLSGERALHYVKTFIPKGGQSYDKTIMFRYDKAETGKIAKIYSKSDDKSLLKMGLWRNNGKIFHRHHYVALYRTMKYKSRNAKKLV